jgi:hypothetical protein
MAESKSTDFACPVNGHSLSAARDGFNEAKTLAKLLPTPRADPRQPPLSSRAALSLGAQRRRLACKIKTSSDFPDAELQRKADPCAHKCSDHCQNLDGNRHRSAKFQGWPAEGMREGPRYRGAGSVQMTRLVIDLVLFSCMFAFVTGIMIAAANLLI